MEESKKYRQVIIALLFLFGAFGALGVWGGAPTQVHAMSCDWSQAIHSGHACDNGVCDASCDLGTGYPLAACTSANAGAQANCSAGGNGKYYRNTCTCVSSGAINVTSNIPGASWTITGPATITGSGASQSNPSEPLGTYTITWGSVPGYITPSSSVFTLASDGSTISFSGSYSLIPTINVHF